MGVTCACLPAVRAFFGHIFPRVFGTTVRDTSEYIQQRDTHSKPGSQIRVQQQWNVSARSQEQESVVELTVMPTRDDQGSEKHVGEKKRAVPRESV